jgi:hypothetical protein
MMVYTSHRWAWIEGKDHADGNGCEELLKISQDGSQDLEHTVQL